MADYITRFRTKDGDKQLDYNALANLPQLPSLAGCANALKSRASGSIIRVNDVSPITHGVTCKVQSKNLFDTLSNYKNGEHSYADGTLTMTGRYAHKFIKLDEGKTYTFSCKSTRTGTDGGGVHIRAYKEDQNTYADIPGASLINILSPTVTVTMPEGYPYIRFAFYGHATSDDTGTATYTELMLEEGEAATGYVPYVDSSVVTVVRYGKNLLDLSRATFTSATYNEAINGLTCKISNSYYSGARIDYLNDFLLANKGKTLTFSIAEPIEDALITLLIYGTRTSGKTNQEGSATGKREISFAISDEFTAITGLEVRVNRQTTAFTDTTTIVRNMQVEVSDTATDFEEYKESASYTPKTDGTVEELVSFSPTMTLLTDTENVIIECEYNKDVNKVIAELLALFNQSISYVSHIDLLSTNWQGTASPYSQVVALDGITQYSKVDINPSVEQLSIFHDKDIAFVAENEDGVVTVYCIGQKPTANYTMQVTITEVNANG